MNMTLYELESKINEYIKEHNLDDARETHFESYNVSYELRKIVIELLGGEDIIKSYGIEIICPYNEREITLKRKQSSIYIEYKRTRYIETGHWNNYAYYGIKSVEIWGKSNFKDLQDFMEQDDKLDKQEKEKHEDDYAKMFENVGVNFYKGGFTLKELLEFGNNFKKLSIEEKKEMFDTYNNGEELWYY